VAASPSSKFEGEVKTGIVDLIFKKKKVDCAQFTVSLDTLSHYPEKLVKKIGWLWNFYSESNDCGCEESTRKSRDGEDLPELCVTAFDLGTIKAWAKQLDLTFEEFVEPLTMLSLSNMPVTAVKCSVLHKKCKETRTILNYNKMMEEGTVDDRQFKVGCAYSDSVYAVFKKEPLGKEQNEESFKHWMAGIRTAEEYCEGDVHADVCITDSMGFVNSGVYCSAGTLKVHVWPDGTCPYDSHHVGRGAAKRKKEYDVWTELKRAITSRKCHAMTHCKIPDMIRSLMKKD
jgi:hypothetical protein